ncbi:ATP-dependent helicase [Bacillus haynesii]|uniref:ATP-dependent helicase n=1 Tax=Bacillus TaxID=1386 RepID=UPI0035E0A599
MSETVQKIGAALGVNFSDEQKAIINHEGAPLNVLSCAGSGKTTVLVAKMLKREIDDGIKPVNMLAVTFNNRAAQEMESRYKIARRKVGVKKPGRPTFKTFHALFKMILETIDGFKSIKVAGDGQYKYPLLRFIEGDGSREKTDIFDEMMQYRGWLINNGLSRNGIENANQPDKITFKFENYIAVMEKYQEMKDIDEVIDFDDMQTILLDQIVDQGNEEPVTAFRRVFKDVYIDEYQDISPIQMQIMDELIGDFNRLTVIGDDDQAIYSFRGSNPSYIRDFTYRYMGAERLFLSDNYRCKKEILDPVIPSISKNIKRVEKKVRAAKEGGEVEVIPLNNSLSELADVIREDTEGMFGEEFGEIGVLVRLNNQRTLLADSLAEAGVQVDIGDKRWSLRNNKTYETIMGIIKMIKEDDGFLFADHINKVFPHINRSIADRYSNGSGRSWFEDVIVENRYGTPKEVIDRVLRVRKGNNMKNCIGHTWVLIQQYYKDLSDRGYGSFTKHETIAAYMFSIADGLTVKEFLHSENIKENFLLMYMGTGNGVQINTLHSVKGLEYDTVYLVGLDNDVIPSQSRIDSFEREGKFEEMKEFIEEERRLFYVGWTRAKRRLVVSYKKKNPSRFLKEIEGLDLPGVEDETPETEKTKLKQG